jgi:Tol biopolymer transport system component
MAQSSLLRRPAVMLVLALASVSLVVTLMGKLAGGPDKAEQKKVQMAGSSNSEAYPSLSADGKQVAYSARESGKSSWHVYVRELPSGTPKQLTRGEENDIAPVFAPDGGTLAFARVGESKVEYIVIPADGGPERKVVEFSPAPSSVNPLPAVSWLPDGKSLIVVQPVEDKPSVLVRVALDGGAPERLTNPPDGIEGDSTPAVSPGGDSLAFVRSTTNEGADVWVADIKGAGPRRVTFDDRTVYGLQWTRDGQDLLYSSNRAHGTHIWRISAGGGSPKDISVAGGSAKYPAVGRNRLAYTDSPTVSAIWRATLKSEDTVDERQLIRTSGRESAPAYSPDGTRIATLNVDTGNEEVFLQDSDGKNRQQLTHMNRPWMGRVRWSPDGKQLIFDVGGDNGTDLYVIGALQGAQPGRVATQANEGWFSQDGKSIYYQSRGQIWKAALNGSNARVLIKRMGASQPAESADGKYVIFRWRRTLWRVPVDASEDAEPEEFIVPDQEIFWTSIQPVKKGVYYAVWERSRRGMGLAFYDYATKKSTMAMHSEGFSRGDVQFSVSPDGKYVIYPKVDRNQTNLMVVENFK